MTPDDTAIPTDQCHTQPSAEKDFLSVDWNENRDPQCAESERLRCAPYPKQDVFILPLPSGLRTLQKRKWKDFRARGDGCLQGNCLSHSRPDAHTNSEKTTAAWTRPAVSPYCEEEVDIGPHPVSHA